MSKKLVLITGGNGHIGFRVVVSALEAGYKVRAAVRNQEKADRVLAAQSIKKLDPKGDLTFTFVPDLLAPGAYNEAVKDVDYIIHIASPITGGIAEDQYETYFIQPAFKGTLAILTAAQTSPSVRRIVITSSLVAIMPWHDFFEAETDMIVTEQNRTSDPTGPYANEFEAYASSKVRALNATEKFLKDEKPNFDVVNVCPSFVIGKDELVTDPASIVNGTNGAAFRQFLGVKQPFSSPSVSVHVDDVAFAHIKALDPVIPANYSLIVSSEGIKGTNWEDALSIVKRKFPRAVKAGVLPNDGAAPTKHAKVDASESARLLGIEFKGYEEQVLSVVEHYLELSGFEAA